MADLNNVIEIDFSEAPPAQGGSGFDRIPEGTYRMKVGRAEKNLTAKGNQQVKIALIVVTGSQQGKRVGDNFVLPRAGSSDSKFPLQRFHAFLVALGMKEASGKRAINLDQVVNHDLIVDIEDSVMPANEQYPERKISRPIAFHSLKAAATSRTDQSKGDTAPLIEETKAEPPPGQEVLDLDAELANLLE